MDPYQFIDESVGRTAPNFNNSFMALFESSDEEDFYGFEDGDIEIGDRVKSFHTRTDAQRLADKENVPPPTKRPRKRISKPESWKQNALKIARATGQEYKNYKGNTVSARKTGPDCGCSKGCTQDFDDAFKSHIIERFNSLGKTDLQNMYLRSLINPKEVQRVGAGGRGGKHSEDNPSYKRASNFEYFVTDRNSTRIPVCKTAFMSLHGISHRRVTTVRSQEVPLDKRGKSENSRATKIKEATLNKIRQHIKSFPQERSHYSRKDAPGKRYLSGELSVQRMYYMYLEKEEPAVFQRQRLRTMAKQENSEMPSEIKPEVSLAIYRRTFNTEFNLGFGRQRTDTCATCDHLYLSGNNAKLLEHQKKAEQGYASKRNDREGARNTWKSLTRVVSHDIDYCSVDAVDMITFDFQQNLPTPTLTHNDMFYQRQLWTYNFGIHDCVAEQGHMFMWDETIAKRGSSEVASSLKYYFEQNRTGAKSLISYSDGCGGQNKNIVIIALFCELVKKGYYSVINHKFLMRGHTFLPNDTDFAQIEKRKPTAVVHLPSEWVKVVEEANQRKPFKVYQMEQEKFLDFKNCYETCYTHKKKTTNKEAISFKQVHWLNFGWGEEKDQDGNFTMVYHPDEVWMRYGYCSDEAWKKVKVWNGVEPEEAELMYERRLKVKEAKAKDLVKMAEKFLPPEKREFYMQLNVTMESDNESIEDTDDDE